MQRSLLYFLLISLATAALAAYATVASGFGALDPAGFWRGLCGGTAAPAWPLFAAAGDMADLARLAGPGACVFFAGVLAWLFFAGPQDGPGRAGAFFALPALAASPLCRLSFDLPMRLVLFALWALSLACLGLGASRGSPSLRRLFFFSAGLLISACALFEPVGLSLAVLAPMAAGLAEASRQASDEAPRDPFGWGLPVVCLGSLGLLWLTLPRAVLADAARGHVSTQLAVAVLFFVLLGLASLAAPRALAGRGLLAWFAAGLSLLLPFLNFRPTPLTPLEDSLAGLTPSVWAWLTACAGVSLALFALRLKGLAGSRARLLIAAACALPPLGMALAVQPRLDALSGVLGAFVLALTGLDALSERLSQPVPTPEPGHSTPGLPASGQPSVQGGPSRLSPCLGLALLVPLAFAAPPFGPAAGFLLREQALAPWARTEGEAGTPVTRALASRSGDILTACREMFARTRIHASDVGLLTPGSPLGGTAAQRLVTQVSPGSPVMVSLTPGDLTVAGFAGFAVHYEYLGMPFYKPVLGSAPGTVTLLPRADVWSWLFVREDQAAMLGDLLRGMTGPGPEALVLEAGEARRYQGYLVERLTLVPAEALRNGAFFGLAFDRFDLGQ